MKNFSTRIQAIKPSPTITLNAKTQKLKKQGKPVISFAVGEPDYDTPRVIVDAAVEGLYQGRTRYGAAGGGIDLRKAISAKLLRENKLNYSHEQIVLGMGAKELLFHLFLSLLNEGDEVIMLAPYWVSYADQVIAAGGVPVVIPCPASFPQEDIDVSVLEKYVSNKTTALIINSPNNPVGYVFSEKQLQTIGDLAKKHDWWVISDEIYEYYAFNRPHISILNLNPELASRVILINGFSKSFAMTGWRAGYACGDVRVMSLLRNLQSQSSTCLPGFIEDAAVVAINLGVSLLKDELDNLKKKRDLSREKLLAIKGIKTAEPAGAFYLFIDVRNFLGNGGHRNFSSSMEMCEFLLNEHYLAFVPGEAFGAPGFIRMSYTVPEKQILEGTDRLEKALEF